MQAVENNNLKLPRIVLMINKLIHTNITNRFTILDNPHDFSVVERGVRRFSALFSYTGIADDRIVDFIVYQVYRFRDMIAQFPNTRWQLTWLFSDNAVEKYKHQFFTEDGKSGINYYIDQWLLSGDLDRQKLTDMLIVPTRHHLEKYLYQKSEEMTKKRFLNTKFGMMMCLQSTTGWTPLSPTCQQCQFSTACMEKSKKIYPEIIRLRQQCTK